ncbi:MAG: DNA polymerase III subunit epsilon [Sphingomonadaceae bacterium]
MREIVFDTETTGLDPLQGHRLVEFGAVELVSRVPTGRHWHGYFNPQRDMPAEAERVHGLTADFLAAHPLFHDSVDSLLEFIGDAMLVAHNAIFDWRFLNHELTRIGRPEIAFERIIDTLELSRKRFPGAKHTLDALCQRLGVDLSRRDKHGALLDAELLAPCYIELSGGRQIGFDLVTEIVATRVAVATAPRPLREFAAPPEELALHADFLDGMKDPVWRRA